MNQFIDGREYTSRQLTSVFDEGYVSNSSGKNLLGAGRRNSETHSISGLFHFCNRENIIFFFTYQQTLGNSNSRNSKNRDPTNSHLTLFLSLPLLNFGNSGPRAIVWQKIQFLFVVFATANVECRHSSWQIIMIVENFVIVSLLRVGTDLYVLVLYAFEAVLGSVIFLHETGESGESLTGNRNAV